MKPLDDPGDWLRFLARQIALFGPGNDHPSYRNPGRAHELVSQWADLAAQPQPGGEAVRGFHAAIGAETARQEVPVHSMWCEIRRGFVAWARSKGQRCG